MRSIVRGLWRRKWWIALLLFGSVLGGYVSSRWPIRGTTADGTTTIELLHVGAGNFDYESDDIVLKTLRKWTPRKLQKYLPQRIAISRRPPLNDAGSHKLQLLFARSENLGPRPKPKAGLRPVVQFIDSAGRIHNGHSDRRTQVMRGFMYLGFDAWPRRDPYLHCRIINRNDEKQVLEFRVRNPCYAPNTPTWTPQPLPAVAVDQDLRVTLKSIQVSASGKLKPEFDLELLDDRNGRPHLATVTVQDASGNSGEGVLATESAWRVRLDFDRPYPNEAKRSVAFFVAPPQALRSAATSNVAR